MTFALTTAVAPLSLSLSLSLSISLSLASKGSCSAPIRCGSKSSPLELTISSSTLVPYF